MSILDEIFATKRHYLADVASPSARRDLRARAHDAPPVRGFIRAIRESRGKPALIAEVKQASPSQGLIRPGFDAAELAGHYIRAGVTCLSVLTDAERFKGSPEDLMRIRAMTELPLLRKDFILDEFQLDEARVWGADCALLIVAGLSQLQLQDLYGASLERGLDVLVEVHDSDETERAVALGCEMIGVNNRDLRTFRTEIETTERLFPQIPSGTVKVSESALSTRDEVERVAKAGADAVLIGTAFSMQQDVVGAIRSVMPWG